mgnify:CR=1 FL=1
MSTRTVWLALGLLCACPASIPTEPADAELVTEDLARFWQAFDEGIDGDLEAALQKRYLDPGTPSLRAFLSKRIDSAGALAETVRRNRGYYESVRANTLAFTTDPGFTQRVRAAFARVKGYEPESIFPPTALLIGRMNSGGTVSSRDILIGLELFTRSPLSPTDTLTDFERNAVTSSENLVGIVAHEHAHVLQQSLGAAAGSTLLDVALMEGVADFVGEKVSGQLATGEAYVYGPANEAALWAEFEAELGGTDLSRWLYNKGKVDPRPGDLGYFIGYRIAQGYAKQRGDDATAIRELLRATDARAVLQASGYHGQPP